MHDRGIQIPEYFRSFQYIPLNLCGGIHLRTHLHYHFCHEQLSPTHNHNRIKKSPQHLGFDLYAQPKSNYGSNNAGYPSYKQSQTYKIGEGDSETLGTSK